MKAAKDQARLSAAEDQEYKSSGKNKEEVPYSYLRGNNTFFFWKGRVALYVLLKAIGVRPGDEIIIPGFTCVVVPNAVIYSGGKPIYADIDPRTYTVTAQTIEPLINSRTKVIIVQNTFGLSPDLDPIMELAESHGLFVIEDCAHGLGSTYKGRPAGTTTHAAFFSTQWSKPISTGLGGIAYVADKALSEKVRHLIKKLKRPSLLDQVVLAAELLVRPIADVPKIYYPAIDLYRFLTQKLGIIVGSSEGEELRCKEMPDGYISSMGKVQRIALWHNLQKLPCLVRQRKQTARHYDSFFQEAAIRPPYRPRYADHSMLRFSVRVPDKKALLSIAKDLRIPIGDWFLSPLHPVEGDLTQWAYKQGICPQAERACVELVNLFTDRPLSYRHLKLLFSTI